MLQGSVDYLVQILTALPQNMASQAVVLITKGNRRRLRDFGLNQFTKISHRHVGGALDHVWWIGSAQQLHIPAAKVHAQLRDMLKCTEEGSFYSGDMSTPAYIPLARINDPVICPSVLYIDYQIKLGINTRQKRRYT
ncbi:predicted protein [Chaetoceros tenuissimus]|uniref:Uncharacterized protein n=1 Tax=Chaetoceros tenuissimus TaxID=426638 RepID=A0AAD3H543_9STRA|nr:predicted protein [Chaetoceros tenuissimus]